MSAPTPYQAGWGRWLLRHGTKHSVTPPYVFTIPGVTSHRAVVYNRDAFGDQADKIADDVILVFHRFYEDQPKKQFIGGWVVQKANGQTGPTVLGFDNTLVALAYATNWLKRRGENKLKTDARRAAFVERKKEEKAQCPSPTTSPKSSTSGPRSSSKKSRKRVVFRTSSVARKGRRP